MRITGAKNPTVRAVRALQSAQTRRLEGAYVVEGVRLISEALETGQKARLVLHDPGILSRTRRGSTLLASLPDWASEVHEVDERILAAAGETATPSGVLAVLDIPPRPSLDEMARLSFGILLDAVSDPGNTGTIIRTAAALGAGYVIALAGTADIFSGKVVRAGMGAHFRLPVCGPFAWPEIEAHMTNVTVVGAANGRGKSVAEFRWPDPCALAVGNEAWGLSKQSGPIVAEYVHIPMRGGVESLNVAAAVAILTFAALGRKGADG